MTTVLSREAPHPFALPDGGYRPPLKWAGGKRWLVPTLREMWAGNEKRRLVEPFCGGLAVVLGLVPERALLNDINPHAINFYAQLKLGLNIKWEMEYDPDRYYEYRTEFNNLKHNIRVNNRAEYSHAQPDKVPSHTLLETTCMPNRKWQLAPIPN
jgi:hypothetical protein